MSGTVIHIITYPITFLIGIFLTRLFENKPTLITYYSHIAAGKIWVETTKSYLDIFTHSIVIRNTGRTVLTNIKVGHAIKITNMIAVYPKFDYQIKSIKDSGEEIVFERLLSKQMITINYVYTTPLSYNQINTYVQSDECIAHQVNVLLNRQWPKWFQIITWVLVALGFITACILLYFGVSKIYLPFTQLLSKVFG